MPNSQGRFAWHELSTTDRGAATTFYSKITPWKTEESELADNYTLFTNGGTPMAGALVLDPQLAARNIPPHWLAYVCVYDVDACARQVPRLGGRVVSGPHEVPGVGCWVVISDPQGATIGMYEPDQPRPAYGGAPPVGEFSWHELATTDHKAAFEFYRPLFQWEKISEFDMGAMGIYFIFGQKGQQYGGMFNRPPQIPVSNWLCYVRVGDVKTAAQTAQQLGAKVMHGPEEVPGGDWIAQCMDPQGAPFALQTPKS